MTSVTGLPRWDPLDRTADLDPYPGYARLRAAGPVCRAGPATYAVTRYAEVAALLRDPAVGHTLPEGLREQFRSAPDTGADLPHIVSVLEPPQHTRIRKLLRKTLGPAQLARLRDVLTARADELIDRGLAAGGLDVVTELALPLQVTATSVLIGLPAADRDDVCRRAVELGRALILLPYLDPTYGDGADEARRLRDYVLALVRHSRPEDDGLVAALLRVRDDDQRLSEDEIVDNLVFLFLAGFETTVHMVANTVGALLRFPDQLARLRADRSLMGTAVEEVLRHDAPIQWIARTTAAPVRVGDRRLHAGRFLLLLLGSANRDERRFADPDRLDIGRHPNPHLAFAGGAHHCLGVQLARQQGVLVLDRLLRRCADLAPGGEARLRRHPNLRGYEHLPLALTPA